jgi:hypothetical protein
MSGLETSAVVLSAVALLVALVLAMLWQRSRRDLRELRRTVEDLAQQTEARSGSVVTSRRDCASVPLAPVEIADPSRDGGTLVQSRREGFDRRADAIVTADGRTVVVPTTAQVVDATMGRPLVRASALAYGLRRALRAENRDRIRSLMRREFQRRRKMRQRAARRAARMAPVQQSEEATYR